MYTIANNNMDGECDRQAKQNKKNTAASKTTYNIEKLAQKKSQFIFGFGIFFCYNTK